MRVHGACGGRVTYDGEVDGVIIHGGTACEGFVDRDGTGCAKMTVGKRTRRGELRKRGDAAETAEDEGVMFSKDAGLLFSSGSVRAAQYVEPAAAVSNGGPSGASVGRARDATEAKGEAWLGGAMRVIYAKIGGEGVGPTAQTEEAGRDRKSSGGYGGNVFKGMEGGKGPGTGGGGAKLAVRYEEIRWGPQTQVEASRKATGRGKVEQARGCCKISRSFGPVVVKR
ncbi:hypothetical protein R3P38DRAFT_3460721 [Favolaschia claudopus]|uniref:Uncharacterized protein n=1 Tax=Favolaschia claudopus TaxID=2862362 RepID=A0AAW0CLE0_9AGAR